VKDKFGLSPKHEVIWNHWTGMLVDIMTGCSTKDRIDSLFKDSMDFLSEPGRERLSNYFKIEDFRTHLKDLRIVYLGREEIHIKDLEDFKNHVLEVIFYRNSRIGIK
jgi:hypothetical protein